VNGRVTRRVNGRVSSRRTAAAALVVLALVSGCSEDGEDYCEAMKEEQKTLTDLADSSSEPGTDLLTPTLESFERLREAAPEELQDEWETVVVAYEALADAVDDAGVDPGEYRPDEPPPGVSAAEAERLAAVASKLASARVVEAVAGIEQHATDVCQVDFAG
jgi:hypothetical protein